MTILDDLKERVKQTNSIEHSVETLLIGIKQILDDAVEFNSLGSIVILSKELGIQSQDLSEAVISNTELDIDLY